MKKLLFLILVSICIHCKTKKDSDSKLQLASSDKNISVIDTSLINSIKKKLKTITKTPKARNYKNISTLNFVASYIKDELAKVCDSTNYQTFNADDNTYKNVIGSIGTQHKKRIIIGAHYDVCGDSEGADDNASGVVGLLELANKLSKEKLNYRIDFVAYTLEEPPFFRTEKMGSYIHAKYLLDEKIPVKGMLCIESIGYFNEKPNSQNYPIAAMKLKYGDKGNFITVVQNENASNFSNQVKNLMLKDPLLKTHSFKGNASLSGVDFSDHLNYWKFNFDAVMITNTALFRNKNYHTKNDMLPTLDLEKMSFVIQQLHQTIKEIE